ncbi:MAG TPA: hypothetical protein VNA23_05140 [Anaerolineales bacterium]|nr:hypothetical protein [Anaerolineales bacterium]
MRHFKGEIYRRYLFFAVILALVFIIPTCSSNQAPKAPEPTETIVALTEEPASTIGYPSVAAALSALRAREDVNIAVEAGWTIITEPGGLTIWSFSPPAQPAYPAVARRVFYREAGAWFIKMDVRCEAEKAACDQLQRDFEALNENMREAMEAAE